MHNVRFLPGGNMGRKKRLFTSFITTLFFLFFTLSCSDDGGDENGGNSISPDAPNTPTQLEASSGTYADSIVLTWRIATTGPVADSIVIYRSYSSDGTYERLAAIAVSSLNLYSDLTAEKGRVYYYRVSAKNSAGESAQSNYDEGHVGEEQELPPMTPYNIRLMITQEEVHIAWSVDFRDSVSFYTVNKFKDTLSAAYETDTLYDSTLLATEDPHMADSVGEDDIFYYQIISYTAGGARADSSEFTQINVASILSEFIPEAPHSLIASQGVFDSVVGLSWQIADDNFSGYILYRTRGTGAAEAETLTVSPSEVIYMDSVTPFDTITYQLAAFNFAGISELSNSAIGYAGKKTSFEFSMNEYLFRSDAIGIRCATVNEPAYTYLLYRSGEESGTYEKVTAEPFDSLFLDTNLTAGTTYYYKARAILGTDTSELSTYPLSLGTLQPAPVNLAATEISSHTAKLSWSSNSSVSGYTLYLKNSSNEIDTLILPGNATYQLPDNKLLPHTTYSFWVHATPPLNVNAEPAVSDTLSFTTLYSYTGTVTASTTLPGKIDITWNCLTENGTVVGNQWAQLFRKAPGETSFTLYKDNLNDTLYSDVSVNQDENYSYFVVFMTPDIGSDSSAVVTGTAVGFEEPDSLWAASNQVGQISIAWNSVVDAASYILYRRVDRSSDWEELATIVSDTVYVDQTVYNSLDYYYGVKAVNADGISSEIVAGPYNYHSAPQGDFFVGSLQATTTPTSVTLTWTETTASGVTYSDHSYIIYRGDGSATVIVDTVTAPILTVTDSEVETGVAYQYSVVARVTIDAVTYTSGNGSTISDIIPQ